MSDIESFATGMANSINSYIGVTNKSNLAMKEEAYKQGLEQQRQIGVKQTESELDLAKDTALAKNKRDLEGRVNEDMAERWLPGKGGKMVAEYRIANNGETPTITEAKTFLEENKTADDRNALRRINMARNYAKDFDNDKDVVKAFTELNQSKRAKAMLSEGNPIGDQAIKVVAARAAGEVGNLAQNEQQVYGGSPALFDWLKRNTKRVAEGTLTDSDRKYLTELFDVYEKYGEGRVQKRHEYHARRYAKHTGVSLEEAAADIGDVSTLGVSNWMPGKETAKTTDGAQGNLEAKKAALRTKLGL